MNTLLVTVIFLSGFLTHPDTSDYNITILNSDQIADTTRIMMLASANLVGMGIEDIFGPISEIRVELMGLNSTAIDNDDVLLEQRIRERIDGAECLGRTSEVAWHLAPWVSGFILLENDRILPIQILLSGIIISDLLFAEVN